MSEHYVPCHRPRPNGRRCEERTIPQVTPSGVAVLWCPACRVETPIPRRWVAPPNAPAHGDDVAAIEQEIAAELDHLDGDSGAVTSALGDVVCIRCIRPRPLDAHGLCRACARVVHGKRASGSSKSSKRRA